MPRGYGGYIGIGGPGQYGRGTIVDPFRNYYGWRKEGQQKEENALAEMHRQTGETQAQERIDLSRETLELTRKHGEQAQEARKFTASMQGLAAALTTKDKKAALRAYKAFDPEGEPPDFSWLGNSVGFEYKNGIKASGPQDAMVKLSSWMGKNPDVFTNPETYEKFQGFVARHGISVEQGKQEAGSLTDVEKQAQKTSEKKETRKLKLSDEKRKAAASNIKELRGEHGKLDRELRNQETNVQIMLPDKRAQEKAVKDIKAKMRIIEAEYIAKGGSREELGLGEKNIRTYDPKTGFAGDR